MPIAPRSFLTIWASSGCGGILARVEHRGAAARVGGLDQLSGSGWIRARRVDVGGAVARHSGRQIVIRRRPWERLVREPELGQLGPIDRVVHRLPEPDVAEQRAVCVQGEVVELGFRVYEILVRTAGGCGAAGAIPGGQLCARGL